MQTSEVTHLCELSSQKYRQLGRESFSPRPSFGWALILQHRRQPSLRWDCVHASALAQGFGLSLKKPTRPVSATGRRAEQGWAPPGRRLHPSGSLSAFYFTMSARVHSRFSQVRAFATLLSPGDSPGKNSGVDCRALLRGIVLSPGLSPCSSLSCAGKQLLYHQRHLGSPIAVFGHLFKTMVSCFRRKCPQKS